MAVWAGDATPDRLVRLLSLASAQAAILWGSKYLTTGVHP